MPEPLTLLVTALAVARLTRIATTDAVFDRPRGWFIRRVGPESMAAYLVVCTWCMSMWIAAPAAWAAWAYGDTPWFQVPAVALALSYAAGLTARMEGGD